MADKSFGLKEINLLGYTGTPSIASSDTLNLEAVTVAISTNVSIGSSLTVGTAATINASGLDVSGIITASSFVGPGSGLRTLGTGVTITEVGIVSATSYYGSVSNLTGVGTDFISAVGVSSGGTSIGVGITQINFTGIGNSVSVDGSNASRINVNIDASSGIDTSGVTEFTHLLVSGVSTLGKGVNGAADLYYQNSPRLVTNGIGVSISGVGNTAYIQGPEEIYIDPSPVGTAGSVRIKGDLYVDGTNFVVDSETITLGDFVVGIATTVATEALTDGAGIGIGSVGHEKTFKYEYNSGTNPSLKSSENLNVASGKAYQVGETEVLNLTTLGNNVVNSSLTKLGTITNLSASIGTITTLDSTTLEVGAATTISSSGINMPTGILTASALISGAKGQILYQTDLNETGILTTGTLNQVLISQGAGNAPTWATAAPSGAIEGITLQDEGSTVGIANSINTINFVGSGITAMATAGLATVTVLSADIVGIDTTGVSEFKDLLVTGVSTFGNSNSDQIDVIGRFGSDLIPMVDDTYSLSTADRFWRNLNLSGLAGIGSLNVSGVSTFGGIATFVAGVGIADSIFHTGDNNTAIRFPSDDTFTVETAGTERLRIISSGRVGIGYTLLPSSPLNVLAEATGTCVRLNQHTTSHKASIYFQDAATNGNDSWIINEGYDLSVYAGYGGKLHLGAYQTTGITVLSNGNVGYGTTSPSSQVHILNADPTIRLEDSDNNNSNLYSTIKVDGSQSKLEIEADTGNQTGDTGSSIDFKVSDSTFLSVINTAGQHENVKVTGNLVVTGITTINGVTFDGGGSGSSVGEDVSTRHLHVSGISTLGITSLSDFTANQSNVTGLSTVLGLKVTGISTLDNNVFVGSAITMYSSSGIISATKFYGSAAGLTDVPAGGVPGILTTGQSHFENVNVSAAMTADAFHGDGSNLTGVTVDESDFFNTGITNTIDFNAASYERTELSVSTNDTKRYIINSMNVCNVGVGTTANITVSVTPGVSTYNTASEKTYLAYQLPVPANGTIELIKQPMIFNPGDVFKVWSTNSNYIGESNLLDVYWNYQTLANQYYVGKYASTVGLGTTGAVGIYTSSSYPTVLESIHVANRTNTGDYPVSIKVTNGNQNTYLVKNLIVPRYSTVELLDKPKRLDTNAILKVETGQTGTIDVMISGRKYTS